MAERVGFEPTVPVRVQQFSRLSNSTTLAPLRELITSVTANVKEFQVAFKCETFCLERFLFFRKKSCINFLHSSASIPDLISIL
jgi:hypothetical protein